jgi:Domain of unknown function (DUF4115)
MNSQVEARFRDVDDARRKLVSFASGVGFRLLVKQALAPGEPLQIDIGDGNLLVLSHYRLPIEPAYSFGVEGTDDGRIGETAISAEKVPDLNSQSVRPQRRGLVLGGIAATIGLSALGIWLGILWEGMRGVGHPSAPPTVSARQVAPAEKTIATSEPQPAAHAGSIPSPSPERKFAEGVSMPASYAKALPVRPVTHVNAKLSDTNPGIVPSTQPARVVAPSNSPAKSAAGSAHSISIKASSASWVTACADGAKVFAKLFNQGDVGEVRFSREATLRSGNAAALELAVGNQSIGPMGPWGQVRTIKVTPAGYEFAAATPTANCNQTSPKN